MPGVTVQFGCAELRARQPIQRARAASLRAASLPQHQHSSPVPPLCTRTHTRIHTRAHTHTHTHVHTHKHAFKRTQLDSIITVVDGINIDRQLREPRLAGAVNEAQVQVAYADLILLNKVRGGGEARREVRRSCWPAEGAWVLLT